MKKAIISFLILLIISGCSKDPEIIYPTNTGANTFSCYINGSLLKTHMYSNGTPILYVFYRRTANGIDGPGFTIFVYSDTMRSHFERFSIFIPAASEMLPTGSQKIGIKGYYQDADLVEYNGDETSGNITITYFDFKKKILSGYLKYTLYSYDRKKVIYVTKAKFDAHYEEF